MSRTRRIVALSCLLVCLALPTARGQEQRDAERARVPPNLLLVTLDTTRADHLGCYGAGKD